MPTRPAFTQSRTSRRLLFGLAIVASGVACNNHPTGPELLVGGLYVLVELDGVAFPSAKPSFQTCPAPISRGELSLSPSNVEMTTLYTSFAHLGRSCDPDDTRPPDYRTGLSQLNRDGGNWSVDGNRVTFSSNQALYGMGRYQGTFQSVGAGGGANAILTFSLGGRIYKWRRVRIAGNPESSTPVRVINEQGQLVAGTRLEARYSDGIMVPAGSSADRPSGISGPVGIAVTIHVDPPPSYMLAPGQSAQVRANVGQADAVVIRLVRTGP